MKKKPSAVATGCDGGKISAKRENDMSATRSPFGYPNVLGMVMAGGEGSRLYPLTQERAKPAVYFGGKYRIVDFVLNNFINSGIFKIKVLTQFKSDSLIKHLTAGWNLNRMLGQYIDPVPAQMRTGKNWYQGTADAVFQNINLIEDENPDYIAVFGADHIYTMDISQMWFDIHFCELGLVISFCDNNRNFRATVIVDEGRVVWCEKGLLIRDEKGGGK